MHITCMPTLQIRDLPEDIYERLAEQARREHRSLAQQATALLERGLGDPGRARVRRKALLERIAGSERSLPGGIPTPEELLGEDRNR